MADDDSAPERRVKMLDPQRMGHAEYLRQDWVCTAEEGTLIEDVLDPAFWSHMAAQLKLYDRIDVRVDTGEWLLELLVLDVGRNWTRVTILHQHDLTPATEQDAPADQFIAKFRGPALKWSVVRVADNHVLQEKMESKREAHDWIRNYEISIRRT